jgi:hypothetical protein
MPRTPKYCHHKASGQAYVTINGRERCLGKHGSPEWSYPKLVDSESPYIRIRGLFSALPLAAFFLLGILSLVARPLAAYEPSSKVSLAVWKASAKRDNDYVHFRFKASLNNATGKDLTVRTNFGSAFGGLTPEVRSEKGKTLALQSCTYHQSPFAPPGREFTLKKGITKGKLVFPIHDFPGDAQVVKVYLSGTLPGLGAQYVFFAKPIELTIEK